MDIFGWNLIQKHQPEKQEVNSLFSQGIVVQRINIHAEGGTRTPTLGYI